MSKFGKRKEKLLTGYSGVGGRIIKTEKWQTWGEKRGARKGRSNTVAFQKKTKR